MEENKKIVSSLLIFLGILFSCAQVPQQIAEETPVSAIRAASEAERNSIVRLVTWHLEGMGAGSGFFVGDDKIVTNIHVIAGSPFVYAKLVDEETVWAIEGVEAFDAKNDLVVLKVSGEGVPLELGKSDTVKIGDPVTTLGFPETQYKVTEGTIHGTRNSDKWIRMKSEYVGGMSGGPVLNSESKVIGIAVSIESIYGYAIPSHILKVLLSQSKPTESLVKFRKRDVIRAYIYRGRGQTRAFERNYDGAIEDFSKAIDLMPDYTSAYKIRGYAKTKLGESEVTQGNIAEAQTHYHEAIEDFNKTIDLMPDFADAYRIRGYVKTKLGESETIQGNIAKAQTHYHEAIEDFGKAIDLMPDFAGAYSNRGYVKTKLGESETIQGNIAKAQSYYRTAIADWTEAIELSPAYAETYSDRGYAEINLEPEYADLYYNRGLVKQALGLPEAAQVDFKKALELNPDVKQLNGKTEPSQALQEIE